MDELFDRVVAVRRWLHSHPEPSGQEFQTSRYLADVLRREGLDPHLGPEQRGLICDLGEASDSPRVALRADVDALRIHDAKQVEYRSQQPGIMHACGHDAHTGLVYGTVAALHTLATRNQLPWPVRLRAIFQPAEETCEGAQQMVAAGVLEGVGAILATHMDPTLRAGQVGLRVGVLTASCDELRVTIRGRGGHAARPHEAHDPIAAAAQFINALYLNVPRATETQEAVVVTIAQIRGGDNANVIPEQVELAGTIRTHDALVRHRTVEHIRRLAAGIGAATATDIELILGLRCGAVDNAPQLVELLRLAGRQVVGETEVKAIPRPSMGSEDFAFYLEKVPGAMMRVGCASDRTGAWGLHTPQFDVDEEALRVGAKILARAVVLWCNPEFQRVMARL